jgi:hypothetical protein
MMLAFWLSAGNYYTRWQYALELFNHPHLLQKIGLPGDATNDFKYKTVGNFLADII